MCHYYNSIDLYKVLSIEINIERMIYRLEQVKSQDDIPKMVAVGLNNVAP